MPEESELGKLDKKDSEDPIVQWDKEKFAPALTYAWNWFSYHANQRLMAFHYFLIIVGILATGYVTCLDKRLYLMQVVIGLAGVLVSIAFLALDIRNTVLVDDGRDALRKLERALGMGTGIHRADYDRPKETPIVDLTGWLPMPGKLTNKKVSISHSSWLRNIERLIFCLFLFATIYGVFGWICYGSRGLVGGDSKELPVQQSALCYANRVIT